MKASALAIYLRRIVSYSIMLVYLLVKVKYRMEFCLAHLLKMSLTSLFVGFSPLLNFFIEKEAIFYNSSSYLYFIS